MKTLFAMLVRPLAAVFGLLLVAGLMLAGLATAFGLLGGARLCSRLCGRPLASPRSVRRRGGRFRAERPGASGADVVDIDARDVREPPSSPAVLSGGTVGPGRR